MMLAVMISMVFMGLRLWSGPNQTEEPEGNGWIWQEWAMGPRSVSATKHPMLCFYSQPLIFVLWHL